MNLYTCVLNSPINWGDCLGFDRVLLGGGPQQDATHTWTGVVGTNGETINKSVAII
jgi:hypothetical protein